jgi:hypothetical protein
MPQMVKTNNISIRILIINLMLLFIGCINEDFSTDPNYKLEFSNDTVNFGLVFSNFSSTTQKLMVYNKNNKSININNISLLNPGNSGFRINVDGMKGNSFDNVEISSNDSLFIFIEITPKDNFSDNPVSIHDIISISCNNSIYNIRLEAVSQDVVIMKGETIDKSSQISSRKPIIIYDSLYISKDTEVEITAGTRLLMHNRASIIVDGSLSATAQ